MGAGKPEPTRVRWLLLLSGRVPTAMWGKPHPSPRVCPPLVSGGEVFTIIGDKPHSMLVTHKTKICKHTEHSAMWIDGVANCAILSVHCPDRQRLLNHCRVPCPTPGAPIPRPPAQSPGPLANTKLRCLQHSRQQAHARAKPSQESTQGRGGQAKSQDRKQSCDSALGQPHTLGQEEVPMTRFHGVAFLGVPTLVIVFAHSRMIVYGG
jgi:hypothetical protein